MRQGRSTQNGREPYVQHAGIIGRAAVVFFARQGLRIWLCHSHAGTLMFAIAASVLTQSAARILRFGVSLATSSVTGRGVMSQSTITGLGASTRSVCLSHSLEFWQQQQKFTVARPHLNFICRVFPGRATGQKPNWAFNVDANSGHAFGILLAAVGTLRPCGAPAPVN